MNGFNKNINEQIEILGSIIRKNTNLMIILKKLEDYSKINKRFKDYYVGAGSINQTVFNYLTNKEIDYGIKDYDIVYYDSDLTYEAEDKIIKDVELLLGDTKIEYDIKNEARVHLWYNKKYNSNRLPYSSCEDAIASWGATVTCIGIRLENDKLIVYCPYGLNDLFSMTIRPVKRYFTQEQYEERAQRWKKKWDNLTILPWNE